MKKRMIVMRFLFFVMLFLCLGAGRAIAQVPDPTILTVKAPETFRALFTTNKGDLNWSY